MGGELVILKGGKKAIKNAARMELRTPKAIDRAMWIWMNNLATKLRKAAPRGATGLLKNEEKGIRAEKLGPMRYRLTAPYYINWLEEGVGKHPVGRSWKFDMWCRMKGLKPFLVRRKIAGQSPKSSGGGTKAHPFTQRIILEELRRLPRQLRGVMSREVRLIARG